MNPAPFKKRLYEAQAGSRAARFEFVAGYAWKLRDAARGAFQGPWQGKIGESDLAQISLLAAAEKLERFLGDTEDDFEGWLYRIVQRKAVDLTRTHRRRAERRMGKSSLVQLGPLGREKTPSSIARRNEEKDRIRAVIRRLPDDWRTVIELKSLDGLTFEEVGRRMDRTAEAARKLWSRAIERLGELLGPES